MPISSAIFKAYDIRGVVPSTLNESVALKLGRAFGQQAIAAGELVVAVGRDGRLSGDALSRALIQGLVEAGIEVIDVGRVTTPMLYFAASTLCHSGIQVTGSHNPKDYNGFKMVLAGQLSIWRPGQRAAKRTIGTGQRLLGRAAAALSPRFSRRASMHRKNVTNGKRGAR